MLFCSIPFMYYFFPITLLLYLAAPKKLKNAVLLLTSLVFYAWGEPKYVIIMAAAILLGYVFGLLIEKYHKKPLSKLFMILSVTVSVGMLAYFKYADFFISNFNAATGLSVPLLKIALPIGISFYTFQLLSYTVDVYRGDVPAQKNPVTLGAYITMFPQLIAGPIVRYSDVEKQLTSRTLSVDKAAVGIRRFIFGLAKKILIANSLGELCDVFHSTTDPSVLYCWLFAAAYCMQVYFDFSGYSDMAIGLGKILGFDFMENFNYPYISASITEFWRRWHISLGSWFRDYVYIPLGGNRVPKLLHIRNILVVWLLTGFWHGAAWNFIVWGLYFAVMLMVEKFFLLRHLEKSKVLSHIYVLFFVSISFVIFNAPSMREAFVGIGNMFGFGGLPFISREFVYYLRSYAVILIIGAVGATPLAAKTAAKLKDNRKCAKWLNIAEPVCLLALLLVSTAYLVDGSFNPFLYFRF